MSDITEIRRRGVVPAGTGDTGLTQPRALRLLFVQTKSNQKVAKTKGFGFLYNFGFILRPRLKWPRRI